MQKGAFIAILLFLQVVIYAQDTAKTERILRQWTLSRDFSREVNKPLDTVFSLFHRFRIAEHYSPVNAGLGNYGLPFYQLNFFDRISNPDNFLYSYYYPFMYVPERAVFMNTQVPFTELKWSFGAPRQTSEQTFRVLHTQNVNRFLNFGLIYDIIYSLGQYSYQRSDDKNFTFFSSYTGNKYKMYFSGGINNITSFENGGIPDLQQLEQQSNTRDVPVNLGGASNAVSRLKNRSLLLVQRYTIGNNSSTPGDSSLRKGFPLSGTFSHILTMEGNRRTYYDELPESGFYDSIFINQPGTPTFDSLSSGMIKNTIRFDFATDESRKFRLGGGAGLRNEVLRYSQIIPTHDTSYADTAVWKRSNNVLVGSLYNNIGQKFGWEANGELFLSGYRAGDFNLSGKIISSFGLKNGVASWIVRGGISNSQPSFWYEQWGSTHFEWNTQMRKELRINAGTDISLPRRLGNIRFDYAIIDNYTDFDSTAYPSQFSGGLSVATLAINKELKAWKFHLNTDIILQKSSNQEVLDLPFITVKSAGFFEHLWQFKSTGGSLNTQLGVDLTYHTEYFPYSYMPATGRFYRQALIRAGNYPFIDVFLNFKLKRTRVFIMLDHVNAGFMGYDYFMTPDYPMNSRMFRYGLSWTFYD